MSRRNSIELRRGSGLRETIPTTDSMFHRSPTAQSILNDTNDKRIIFQTSQRRSTITLEKVAKLVYNTSYGGKMEFELIKDETSLGRREDNDICLSDVKISKFHASIIKKDNVYYVMDKNSSNGVLVNDALIEPETLTRLYDNDVLLIGSIPLKFLDAGLDSSFDTVSLEENNYTKLVTILPSEKKYEETITIHQEFEAEEDTSFSKVEDLINVQTLKEDYEKLRLAYELSRMSVTVDVNKLLKKSLDLMFDIVPVERGVVLLVDGNTGFLSPHYVKLLDEKSAQGQEILLSSTILNKVFYSRKCVITRDAWEDPLLGKAASVRHGQIRSVICVPLMAHATVYGILHLDSKNRVNSFSSKDISLVKAISNQTAMVIENMNLIREVEKKARITEQLSRFLPPHVVDRMTNRSEMIRTGGREMVGTIVFADIRGFTKLSEKSNPTEVLSMLNDYFERLVKIVFKFDGIVDKYIGDALMASFGTIEDVPDAEYRAVAAGIAFQDAVSSWNVDRKRNGKLPISVGVGINTGVLLAGFIGSSQRLEYTCIGDTVNTSSRICDQAMGTQVLIGEATYQKVKHRILCEPMGKPELKGKEKEVSLYNAIRVLKSRE